MFISPLVNQMDTSVRTGIAIEISLLRILFQKHRLSRPPSCVINWWLNFVNNPEKSQAIFKNPNWVQGER